MSSAVHLLTRLGAMGLIMVGIVGCGSLDPTSQSMGVTFVNDLAHPIELRLCSDDACTKFDYADKLAPRASTAENISDADILTRWLITDASGHPLGCLPLRFNGRYPNIKTRASQAVPCPGQKPLIVVHGPRTSGPS
jgi:hypothetical protein